MRIVKFALLALLTASLLSALSYAAAPDRITGALGSGQTVTLRGNVNHKALPQYDRGPADPSLRFGSITLLTVPTPSQQKALTRLLAEQQDPKSPNYHKWLTPEQWADRFGLSSNDVQKIRNWLRGQGFDSIRVARGRNWITFSGTAAQVESTFGTEIHRFEVDGEMHVANATPPMIPAALSGIVTGIRGLDDFHLRPMGLRRVRPYYYDSSAEVQVLAPGDIATIYDINALYNASTPIDGTGQKLAVIEQTDVYLADLTDFRTGFGLSSINCTGTNASGIITACSDPHLQYVVANGLPDPGTPLSEGDLEEADLDLEWSGAVARGATIIYVNAPANSSAANDGVWTAWYYAVDQDLAPVISMSYGICEFGDNSVIDPATGLAGADETELQMANSEGITFVNASGDSGAAECDPNSTDKNGASATGGLAVNYPASSPEVTGAGGTSISIADLQSSTYWGTTNGTNGGSALSYVPEGAWNDDAEIGAFCAGDPTNLFCEQGGSTKVSGWVPITSAQTTQEDIGISSSGGGASNCALQNTTFTACVSGFPQPSWQSGLSISGQTAVRFSPDVSILASPNFPGYIFCTQNSDLGDTGTGSACASGIAAALALPYPPLIGGTSASAPIFAGIVTLMNQYLAGTSSSGLGNINPVLYQLAASAPTAFHQVTTGDNQVYCTPGTPGSPQPAALDCPSSGTAVIGFQASNYDATTGYNLVTGLGSVDVNNLATAWGNSRPSSSTSVSPSLTETYQTNSVTLTATVTPSSATGNVTFAYCSNSSCTSSNATTLGAAALNSSGIATYTTTALPVGTNTILATYGGNGTVGASSNTTTVKIDTAFTLAANAQTYTVTPGQSATVNITVTANDGFSGNLTYTCTEQSTLTESTCTGPTGPQPSSQGVSFVVTTTAPTSALRRPFDRQRIFYAVLFPGLVGIMFTFSSRKRALGGMRMLGLIMVLGFSTLWLGSCGGNNSSQSNPGTPAGNYTVTITANSGSGQVSGATGQVTVTLDVQ